MGRFSGGGSYNHKVRECPWGYQISWTVDRYYAGSRLRFPRTVERDTDEAGAKRFAKKWDIVFPAKQSEEI